MNKGIPYHILTITGIFFALGIGIFIGSMLNGEQLMVSQQNRLMNELRQAFGIINKENEQLKYKISEMNKEEEMKDELLQTLYEDYVKGKLEGCRIAVIMASEQDDYIELQSILEEAGANVLSVSTGVNLIDDISVFGEENYYAKKYSDKIDYIIFFSQREAYSVNISMLEMAKRLNIPVLMVGRLSSEFYEQTKEFNIPIITTIETYIGKVSLLRIIVDKIKNNKIEVEGY